MSSGRQMRPMVVVEWPASAYAPSTACHAAPIGSRILSWNSIIALAPITLYLLLYCETGSGVSARARDCLALSLAARALRFILLRHWLRSTGRSAGKRAAPVPRVSIRLPAGPSMIRCAGSVGLPFCFWPLPYRAGMLPIGVARRML